MPGNEMVCVREDPQQPDWRFILVRGDEVLGEGYFDCDHGWSESDHPRGWTVRFVPAGPWEDHDHFKRAEVVAHYVPTSMLNVALEHGGQTVGVVQLLRTGDEADFTEKDLAAAVARLGDLGSRIVETAAALRA